MSETTALLWMVAIIALRLGFPFLMAMGCCKLINAWVEHHQDEVQTA